MPKIFRVLAVFAIAQVMAVCAWAQDNYLIKPGDILRIEVLEDASLNRQSLVLPDGRISVPLAGTVLVGGRSIDDVRADITRRLASNFSVQPTVFVSLTELGQAVPSGLPLTSLAVPVYFLGEVNNPGMIEVEPGTTLLQAIAQVGGFSRFAALKRIQLRRTDKEGNQSVYRFNYKDVLNGESSIGGTTLATGDVIVVPPRKLFE
ncbi:sugar transporter [Pseudooceanicola lipolyticus]|uniref:Sugar transporter n=1 Tax=Pseudooceanicola lipolyticus TaxID=2029104 RepID=A0A2M8IZ61_9RHOB|nr:polysaccharide biosynthesis/export family protein [Pseudooceanicola lipolyticus]PJE35784.1 sugar transporter [Pseudooceanicola lipolyticus]